MPRSVVARVTVLTSALTLLLAATASADRAFTPRFTANDTGQITGIANSLMTCPASTACTTARAAGPVTAGNTALDNNSFNMGYVDIDGDSTTFDSSSATLALPAGSTILFAGLYWGGDWSTGTVAAPNASARNTVKLKAPGATTYTSLTATTLDDSALNVGRYQAFVDVTSRVAAAGNGLYTVADVQAGQGTDHYAGWSLIIAYRNAAEPARNLTIFDGLKTIRTTDPPTDIPVSGFLTPPTGAVNTDIGFVTYEGDNGIVGDSASLNGTVLSDAKHPANNFFDSHISTDGVNFTAKNPNSANQQGFDVAFTNADGILANSATSATIRVTTSGDQYLPGVITFATEISAPKITQTKTVADDNGANVEEGDVLTYTIAATNSGLDGTSGYVLRDPIPADVDYVAGSLRVNPTAGTTPPSVTDATGDDVGEYVTASNQIVARLGTGATATAGGNVRPGASYIVTFKVRVHGPATTPVPPGTVITNTATATYLTQTTGTPLTATSTVSSTVRAPDLRLTKTRTGPAPVAGATTQYTLVVDNVGTASSQGVVTVDDPLPSGVTQTSIVASGWTCTTSTTTRVTCTRSDPLAVGASYPPIVINVKLSSGVTGTLANTGTVSGGGDGNLENNTSRDTSPSTQSTDLSLMKTASSGTVNIGQTVVYTLTARNDGPSDATSVVITDPLPAGFAYVTSTPTCTIHPVSGVLSCAIGNLAAGASAVVTITARAQPEAGATTQTNVARVGGAQSDPNPLNDTASVPVAVSGADLAVTKTSSTPEPVRDANTVSYVITVRNNGGSAATGVVLTDTLPAALTNVTNNRGCPMTATAVTCTVGNMSAGASYSVTVTGRASTPSGPLVNRASAVGNEPDPDLSNNAAELSKTTAPTADLSIAKTASAATRGTGDTLTYTLTVTNLGPNAATNAVAGDVLPTGLDFVSASGGCTYAATTRRVTCPLGTLASGASATRAITTTVNTSAPNGTLMNNATTSSDVFDGNPSNDQAQAPITIVKGADLALTKTASAGTVGTGDTLTFTLSAENRGPDAATGVTLTDVLPAGVTYVSSSGGCTFDGATRTVTCAVGTLATGATATRTITTTVDPDAGATIANSARVTATTPDPEPSNDTGSSTTDVVKRADVAVVKTAPAGPLGAGDTLAYTVRASNAGPDTAHGVVVTDVLPAGVTFVSAPGCAYTPATRTVRCDGLDLASGADRTFTITTTVDSDAPGTLANTASVDADEPDPDPSDNDDTAETTTARQADLSLEKSAPAGPVPVGSSLTYTLTVRNAGPDTATNVVIRDQLPAGIEFDGAPPGCAFDAGPRTVTCTIGSVAPGATVTRTVTTHVDPSAGITVTNSAAVTTDTLDPDPSNDSDDATTAIDPDADPDADLEIEKTASDATPSPGDTVTYTLTVTNHGPAGATGVVASDTLPAGVTFVSADADCTRTGQLVTCDAGDLADGESRSFDIVVTVDAAAGGLDPSQRHFVNVSKLEEQISLNPGETRTVSVTCAGGIVTDGSFRIDQVDQGTGRFADVHALESRATGDRTWQVTLRNDATGRAQAKIFAVCINPDGHPAVLSGPVTTTQALGAGTHTVDLPCGPGQVAIDPGFQFAGGDARVRRSEDDGSGWSFTVDVPVATTATFSIRCLDTQLAVVAGHTHTLQLSHPQTTATIPAGQTVEVQVTCADDAKGIVATSDLAAGLVNLGNDPRPKTRALRLFNPTGAALSATVDLLCVGDRTGGEVGPRRTIDNTATVTGTAPDANAANNSSTARIVVE